MMNGHGKSDRPAVPVKSPNKAGHSVAEGMEGRGLAKGNPRQQNAPRTPSRTSAPSALERVRQAARRDKKMRFTALLHHIYRTESPAPGVPEPQAGRRSGSRRSDVAALWRGVGSKPPRSLRTDEAGSVPGQAGAQGVHRPDRRAAATARDTERWRTRWSSAPRSGC